MPFPAGKKMHTLSGHTDDVNVLVLLPEGEMASGSDDKTVRVWAAGPTSAGGHVFGRFTPPAQGRRAAWC